MSEENVETGNLICVIGNAGKHVWTLRGFDLFLYEHAVAAIRVTARETFTGHRAGLPEGLSSSEATQRRLSGKEAQQPIPG